MRVRDWPGFWYHALDALIIGVLAVGVVAVLLMGISSAIWSVQHHCHDGRYLYTEHAMICYYTGKSTICYPTSIPVYQQVCDPPTSATPAPQKKQ